MIGLAAALVIGAAGAQAQNAPSHVIPGNPPPPQYQPPSWFIDWLGKAAGQENEMKWWGLGGSAAEQLNNINQLSNPSTPSGNPSTPSGRLGGPISLSMYSAGFAGLDFSSSRSSGYRVSDTAGFISAPNARAPGYRSWASGAGLNLSVDASGLFNLDANSQRLWFGLTGDFHYDSANFAASALTPGGANAHAASTLSNTYTVKGSATYMINSYYFSGGASFDFNHANITNNVFVPGAQGDTSGRGYSLNATVGKLIPLVNTIGLNPATMVKAPPATPGGYALFLDVSGHYAYRQEHEDGFTDNTGFVYGTQQLSYSDVGARARLIAVVPDRGFAWMPFVGATVDRDLGLRSTFDIPAQAVTPADTLIFSPSTTFWGTELGFDLLSSSSAKFGMKAFYQASADTRTVGGAAFLKIPFEDFAPTTDSGIRIAPIAGLPVKAPPPPQAPALWNWTGFYLGAHVGGGLSIAKFSDPFGTPIYGDTVRSPGFLGGGQIGYNWQAPGSRWVFGVEADGSFIDSDGTATCFAVSAQAIASSCRVRPNAAVTLTGRVGYTFGPAGRTLIYGKAGLAWMGDTIGQALNTYTNFWEPIASNSQTVSFWGGVVGIGVERALTPAWSLKAEYDYLGFASSNVSNLGSLSFSPAAGTPITGIIPPGRSAVSQSFQEVKLGLNYKWGADPWAAGWASTPFSYPMPGAATGWEFEGGGRYFGSWGQFHKDMGYINSAMLPSLTTQSRLNYEDMQTNSGEFFGRIETPWNLFVKGYVGGGSINNGHMNDEDAIFFITPPPIGGYENTLSPAVTGDIHYGAIDGGYDFLRGAGYKVGAFAGYFHLNQEMNAFGCAPISFINCTPNPVPTSGSPVITETDKWDAVRIGIAAEAMLTERVKISLDAAYLPWVWFNGLDQHFIGNTGVLAEIFSASGKGSGVQLEALLSYYVTPQWSVGLGGRYWGMWTTTGQYNCTVGCPAEFLTPTTNFKAQVEQIGAFVQTSYKFDWGGSIAALH
jgi:hypothetical protein